MIPVLTRSHLGRVGLFGLLAGLLSSGVSLGEDRPKLAPTTQPAHVATTQAAPGYPLLWALRDKGSSTVSYVFGTIHLPDERVTKLPATVRDALLKADELNTELPMDMATQVGAMQAAMLPTGKTLDDVLPKKLYERIDKYLGQRGLSVAAFRTLRPWVVGMQLELLDYLNQMATQPVLDQVLYTFAEDNDKEVGGLETLDEQLGVFGSMSDAEQAHMLEETLDRLERHGEQGGGYVERMLSSYLSGRLEGLAALVQDELDLNDPLDAKFYKLLITDRNRRMAERIAERVRGDHDKSWFFAVGALHLPNDDGVLHLLETRGFELTRVTPPPPASQPAAGK